MKQLYLAMIGALSLLSARAEADPTLIKLLPHPNSGYYAWVVSLAEGPSSKADSAYRVAQLRSEIYDTVLIEGVSYGDEGCCKKLKTVQRIDLEQFAKQFGFHGELAGFTFLKWLSSASFSFRFKEREFQATIQSTALSVTEVVALNNALQ